MSSTAPCFFIEALRASATLSTTMASFSSTQITLLSNEWPSTTLRAACSMFAVASTTAGGFPGPAQMARLPEFIAACTTPGPPVTTSRRTSGCFISSPAEAMVGSATVARTLAGPPAATMARFRWRTVAIETRLAEGCALKTTVLPAATIPIALQMIVDDGFVTGVMAPMTPNGAGSSSIRPWSPEVARGTRSSTPGVLLVTRRFFWILSSTRPSPVSSTASRARGSACPRISRRMFSMIARRCSSPSPESATNAARAALAASSTVAKTPSPRETGAALLEPEPAGGAAPMSLPAIASAIRRMSSGLMPISLMDHHPSP